MEKLAFGGYCNMGVNTLKFPIGFYLFNDIYWYRKGCKESQRPPGITKILYRLCELCVRHCVPCDTYFMLTEK
jgi:hypothetical protein